MADENQIRQTAKNEGLSAQEQENVIAFSRSHPEMDAEQVVKEYKKSK